MARNVDIVTGTGLDEGLIQLTLLAPSETDELPITALLTARGKDHQMTSVQLEKLGNTCLAYAKRMRENYPRPEKLYILRLYDMFDGWMDIGEPTTKAKAEAAWNKKTHSGTKNTKFGDGDYWRVFPANTRMRETPEHRGR
jgi:hypothetical protein